MVLASLIALLAIGASLIFGFRRGILRQIPILIGDVTGIVCARIFAIPARQLVMEYLHIAPGHTDSFYIISNLAAGGVFFITFLLFYLATMLVAMAFRDREVSVFSGIWGALASLFTTLLLLSISYNFIVCINPGTVMMSSMRHSDGNIVHSVMMVAPVLIGSETPEQLDYRRQLEEARSIS